MDNTKTIDENRPNILFILTDDQGPWAMSPSGNTEIITPNLGKLAAEGMRFENFFCTSPVCSPARASILTGTMPSVHGVHDWIREGNVGNKSLDFMEHTTAFTELLKNEGYTCGLSGKWHLGNSALSQKGFDHWYAHQLGGGPYYGAPMVRNGELITEEGYVTDTITDDAIAFLKNHQDKNAETPFYLSVHYTAPHSPWLENHPQEYLDMYKGCPFESCPQEDDHPWVGPHDLIQSVKPNVRGCLEGYFAAVTAMDHNVGRILDTLDALGNRENTLVFFTSDNGFNCGHHGIWGKGNGTFPLNMYENSVKVPFIVSYPGKIPGGTVRKELVSQYDIMPTILEYTHTNPKRLKDALTGNETRPGRSFTSLLRGEEPVWVNTVVVYSEYGPTRMIRTEKWKYVHRYPYGPNELYDLEKDSDERMNLAEESGRQPTITMLKERLDNWFRQHTLAEYDGTKEAVTGHGQIYLSGKRSLGRPPFVPVQPEEF